MTRAEELADEAMRGSCCEGERDAVLNAIRTYGEEVRKRAANIIDSRSEERHGWDKHGDAEAIEKMDLP